MAKKIVKKNSVEPKSKVKQVASVKSVRATKSVKPVKPVVDKVEPSTSTPKRRPEDSKNIYVAAIIILTLSMLLFGAILSYFDTWQRDQSFNSFSQIFELSPYKVENAMGKLGAITANVLVGRLFGIFALCIPLMFVAFSFVLFRVNLLFYRKSMVALVPLTLIGSTALAYISPDSGIFGSSLGGEWGYTVYIWLVNIVGESGAGFVIFALFAIWLVFTSLTLFKYLGATFSNIVDALIAALKSIVMFFSFISKGDKRSRDHIEQDRRESKIAEESVDVYTPFVPDTPDMPQTEDGYQAGSQYEYQNQGEYQNQDEYPNQGAYQSKEGYQEDGFTPSENKEEAAQLSNLYASEEYQHDIDRAKYATIVNYDDSYTSEPSSLLDDNLAVFEIKNIDPIDASSDLERDSDVDSNTDHNTDSDIVPSTFMESTIERDYDDYSQTIDRNNIVMFKSLDDGVVYNKSLDNTSLDNTLEESSVVSVPVDIATEVESSAITNIEELPTIGNVEEPSIDSGLTDEDGMDVEHTPISRASAPKASKDIDFEIATIDSEGSDSEAAGGYTASDDIKDGFEVSVTSNAEIQADNIPESENVTITTNYSEEVEDIDMSVYDPTRELSSYKLPPLDLLENRAQKVVVTEEELYENKNRIVETLNNFNISIDKIKATIGPTVTLYEIKPSPGVRISKIKNLEDDIALSLSALGIRIIAPIPGKGTIGIEVPNKNKEVVSMYSVVKSAKFNDTKFDLPIVLGRTIQNEDFVIDLAKLPHLLVAGATGQGKSVGLNAIITSLLYKKHPAELKFVLIDPKKVELTLYSSIEKHYLAKMSGEDEAIITDTQKVIYTLNSLCIEMDSRYDLLKMAKVRNIKEYNAKFTSRRLNPNKGHRYMPYFVVIIDEFADLIMTAGREIEVPIARIAQLARAVGIHLVIATQRPTTNIITGVIKANFPARIAFRVSSMIDSRTILDQPGANQLIGCGDMLVSTGNEVTRVQCAFIDTPEVESITDYIHAQRGYPCAYELPEFVPESDNKSDNMTSGQNNKKDDKFVEVARYVVQHQQGSASTIQRNFSIGFNRAGRLMDQLERVGIVSKQEGSKPRKVLISDMTSLEMIFIDMEDRY